MVCMNIASTGFGQSKSSLFIHCESMMDSISEDSLSSGVMKRLIFRAGEEGSATGSRSASRETEK